MEVPRWGFGAKPLVAGLWDKSPRAGDILTIIVQ